ncbi:MAG: HEAT repeat domain-containing protein [Chloroflexota bacterium]
MNQNKVFQVVLDALLDESQPFPPRLMYLFSDIQPDDLSTVLGIWPKVSQTRKRGLLEDLENLAEADTLLSFDDFARSLLDDEDGRVRTLAIRLLWECDDAKLVPVYTRILTSDPEPVTRAAAATALGNFINLGELEEIPEELLHEVEEVLLDAARSAGHELVQRRAVEALGFSSVPEVPPLIENAFARKEADWKISALFAMGRSHDKRWDQAVLGALDHSDPNVRGEAIRAAGELPVDDARETLIAMLENEDEEEDAGDRMDIVWALSQIGGEGVREALESLYDDLEDEDEIEFLDEALDNLTFTEELNLFDMFEFDTDEEDDPDAL